MTMGCTTALASRSISAECREAMLGLDALLVITGMDNALGTPSTDQTKGPLIHKRQLAP